LETLKKRCRIWGDDFRNIPEHFAPYEDVRTLVHLLGLSVNGFGKSDIIVVDAKVAVSRAWDSDALTPFVSLGTDLFAVVMGLIAAGYRDRLPVSGKVAVPSDQLIAQVRDLAERFEQLYALMNVNPAEPIANPVARDGSAAYDGGSTERQLPIQAVEPRRQELGRPGNEEAPAIDYAVLAAKLRRDRKGNSAALLDFMKDRESAPYDDVKSEVLGNPDVEDTAVRKLTSETTKLLVKLDSSLYFGVATGNVVKHVRPPVTPNSRQ
jgi:hypothetical protein